MFCFSVASAAAKRFFASSIAYIASSSLPSSSSICFCTFSISWPSAWYSSFFFTDSCWVRYLAALGLGGADLGLQDLLLGLELADLALGGVDRGLLGGDPLLDRRDLPRDGLQLRLDPQPLGVAVLQDEERFDRRARHGPSTVLLEKRRSIPSSDHGRRSSHGGRFPTERGPSGLGADPEKGWFLAAWAGFSGPDPPPQGA